MAYGFVANSFVRNVSFRYTTRIVGQKGYELSNHLGNVMAVVSDKVTGKLLNPAAPLPTLAVKRAGLSAAYDYYPFGMQMPARVVEDATVQCVPITRLRKVDKITDSRDLVYDYEVLPSPGMPQFVPSGANTTITYRNVSGPFALAHYNVDMKAVTGSNLALDAKMTLDPLPSGTTGLIVDFSFVEANHPTVTGTNRNLIAKGNLGVELRNTSRPGYEGESLVLTWVNGSGSARLVVPPGKVLPGDVIRVWMHYDGPPLPASLPTHLYTQQAKFSYTSLVRHIVKPVDQQYVALSCDTDGAYAATYKYGFNGQQKDDEVAGKGNHNTALFWEYDTRLARRWNVDPVVNEKESAYAVFSGNPISNTDVNGDKATPISNTTHNVNRISENTDKKTFTINETTVVNSVEITKLDGGKRERVQSKVTTINSTTMVGYDGKVLSSQSKITTVNSESINEYVGSGPLQLVVPQKVTNVSSQTQSYTSNEVNAPLAATFSSFLKGKHDVYNTPVFTDMQKVKQMTPDMPGAGDGTTGGYGRLGEAVAQRLRNSNSMYSVISKKGTLSSGDFVHPDQSKRYFDNIKSLQKKFE